MAAEAPADAPAGLPSVKDAWVGIQRKRTYRYVMYELGEDRRTWQVACVGERKKDRSDFVDDLPDTHVRACVYDLEEKTGDGRRTSKLFFIYWTPKNCNVKDRISYTAALRGFRNDFPGVTNIDASEEEELEELLENESF